MDKAKDDMFTGGGGSHGKNKIFPVDYNREKIRSDLKNYINAHFLGIFKPGAPGS